MDTYRFRKQIHKLPGKVIHRVPLPEPQVVEGHGARVKIGEICEECGYKQVLLVTDQTLQKLGYEQRIMESLEEVGVACTLFADINSEPNIALIDEGRKIAMKCQAECVIALGGGSVMDTCKMIAAGVKMPHLSSKTLLRKFLVVPGKTLPMITVPSTAGEVPRGHVRRQRHQHTAGRLYTRFRTQHRCQVPHPARTGHHPDDAARIEVPEGSMSFEICDDRPLLPVGGRPHGRPSRRRQVPASRLRPDHYLRLG